MQTLLYADDMANIGDTVGELQKQTEWLEIFCILYGIKMNLSKTKMMIFRRGGYPKKNEK